MSGERFKEVVGRRYEKDLKQELARRGLIETYRRGERLSYVVQRVVPGKRKANFVVLRQKGQRR